MAQHRGRQGEWPRVQREPDAYFAVPDGYYRSDRDVAGTLRMGTTRNVGPKGEAVIADREKRTDYGMDRVDPNAAREINKGTSSPPPPIRSKLIARVERG